MASVGAAMALVIAVGTVQGDEPRAADGVPVPARQSGIYNPDIGVVFDNRAVFKAQAEEEEEIKVAEAELAFAADIDPFLRGEAYIAIADEDGETEVEVEEAFATYSNLGRGMAGKFGKFAGAIGRVNRNHGDQLEFIDYPLVIQKHLGEEGLRAPGGSISYLFPGERYLDLTLEAVAPSEDGPLFMGTRSSNPIAIAHLRTFFDFTEDLSGQLGFSLANGPTAEGRANMYGLDYVMKWQPGTPGRFWQFEAEAYWADEVDDASDRTHGYFVSATTTLRPRLFATAKYDFTEIPGTPDDLKAMSLNLTLKVTEFHYWRLEYKRVDPSFEDDFDRLELQFVWSIGAHPAHKY